MRYLIIHNKKSFYTNWYDFGNNYVEGMIVIQLHDERISFNGKDFTDIPYDNL